MIRYFLFFLCVLCLSSSRTFSEEEKSCFIIKRYDCLTLKEALELACLYNPQIQSSLFEVRAKTARVFQESRLPNPELEISIEDFAGGGVVSGFNQAESTLRVSQLIELGGKRKYRTYVAQANRLLSLWDYRAQILDILTNTAKAFIETVFAEQREKLAKEQYLLAQRVYQIVFEKAKAGKVSPVEEAKAKVALTAAEIEFEKAKRDLALSKETLVSFFGGQKVVVEKVKGDIENVEQIPSLKDLLKAVIYNPDLARWEDEIQLRKALVFLEKSQSVPDISLGGGVRRYEEIGNYGFVVSLSIPLLLFNKNQGAIREAKNRLSKTVKEYEVVNVRVCKEVVQMYQKLSFAYKEVLLLKESVLPSANQAFAASAEGYQQGKFEYLEVLDAQRTFFQTKAQYLDALLRYHLSLTDLERLTGGKFGLQGLFEQKENE